MSLNGLYNALGYPLAFFYYLIPNLGIAILLLTCAVMLILYPLTAKQARSMMAMQRLQPEIKKLQAKYKGDRQKLNEEVMKVYQENKVNPLAGCLPLLVQMPIFFGLFRALKTPYQHVPKTGTFSTLYNAMCMGYGANCGRTGHLHHLTFLGIDLFKTPTDSSLGFPGALPYYVLVAVVVLTGLLQTRQAQSRTPAANKQMGTVMKILPVFFGLITLEFPAGLGLYFAVSNLWRVGQQEIIFRHVGTATSRGSKTRQLDEAQKANAIDVASGERDDEDDAPPDPEPVRAAPKPKPKPRPKPAPRAADRRAPAKSGGRASRPAPARPGPAGVQEAGGGGLRGFFKLPPPPESNGGGRSPGATRPPSNGGASRPGGSGSSNRGPEPRSAKKKRKR